MGMGGGRRENNNKVPQMSQLTVGNRKVGEICTIGRFRALKKEVKKSKHLLRNENAWGVDKKLLDKYKPELIQIFEQENGDTYQIRIENFNKYGKMVDYGFGEQISCGLEHWTVMDKDGKIHKP